MIALALLASHLVGDFIFQTRWQSAGKFGWKKDAVSFRTAHCLSYTLAFFPVVAYLTWPDDLGQGMLFLLGLFVLHFLTDSRRFYSTFGDWCGWHTMREKNNKSVWGLRYDEWEAQYPSKVIENDPDVPYKLPPNPWPALPLMIDQTLHVVQLAALGWLLL